MTELKGPGWRDPRKWWVQILDPFDFGGCMRKDPKFDFWNHPETTDGEESTGIVESESAKAESSNVVGETQMRRI